MFPLLTADPLVTLDTRLRGLFRGAAAWAAACAALAVRWARAAACAALALVGRRAGFTFTVFMSEDRDSRLS